MGKIENLLIYNGLNMNDCNNDGYSGNDYLTQKLLSEEDLLITKLITTEYKKYEEELYSLFFTKFERCDMHTKIS